MSPTLTDVARWQNPQRNHHNSRQDPWRENIWFHSNKHSFAHIFGSHWLQSVSFEYIYHTDEFPHPAGKQPTGNAEFTALWLYLHLITNHQTDIHYIAKSIGSPLLMCASNIIATVLEVSKMTVPICTSHWCLVMSFWLKVCIYSHTRGVKLGLGLGFMQTSQVLPHWLNQSFSFWTLSYTQRYCHVRIEKSPNCYYNIRSTQFPRISLYALTLRFVLIEMTTVVKPVH